MTTRRFFLIGSRERPGKVSMEGVTNVVGVSGDGGVSRRAPAVSAASSAAATAAAGAASASQQVRPVSPSMRSDPMSGVLVTEYLSSNGDVQVQIPSAASVAYMRIGLTATGEPKRDENENPKTVVA